ncbi:MAG: VanZ family protein [Gammaproteobacteria bacterium]|nr:VanZ family protein [Gammaproteobacteria bacterium]
MIDNLDEKQLPEKRLVWLSLAWGWVFAVIYLSLTAINLPTVVEWQDKVGHVAMYGVPMWWFLQLYPKHRHWLIALGLFALGAGLEFAQSFHPLRYMDYYDMLANGAGIAAGWLTLLTPFSRFFVAIECRWLATAN